MSETKKTILDKASAYHCPGKVQTLAAFGLDMVIGRREGYRLWDVDGKELLDAHLNGGTFNLGHRNAELCDVLKRALDEVDIGNHHFPSAARADLAERLAELTPGDLRYSVFTPSGGEAIDVAIKTARRSTGRRRIVSVLHGYHGHTGLALAAGDDRFKQPFLSEGPKGEFTQVSWGDLGAMEEELAKGDVAAVLMETIPATFGFPMPEASYLPGVRALCTEHGSLYVADGVQTGLGRTGPLWAVSGYGVEPDVLVTAKGLSGGLYPIGACVISERHARWLHDDGFGHVSTFGGAELGCRVALAVLDLTTRHTTRDNVERLTRSMESGLAELQARYPSFLVEVRQRGLVIGLRFDRSDGAIHVSRALYEHGVWAMFASYDPSVLQFKPGLLLDEETGAELLTRLDRALAQVCEVLGLAA
jgi:acetylornithine/succinyldiaminopimelate/putrescine aminotransferase